MLVTFYAIEANGDTTKIEIPKGGTFGQLFEKIFKETGKKVGKVFFKNCWEEEEDDSNHHQKRGRREEGKWFDERNSNEKIGDKIEENSIKFQFIPQDPSSRSTPLHQAAEKATAAGMERAIQENPNIPIDSFDNASRTPLYIAVVHRNQGAAQTLIEAGADCNAICTPLLFNCPMTPLYAAVCNSDFEMVDLLVGAGGDPNVLCGWDKETALHFAANQGHVEMVRVLTAAGANVSIRNLQGETAHEILKKRWPIAISDEIRERLSLTTTKAVLLP
jgi:ankyrin repeat protein